MIIEPTITRVPWPHRNHQEVAVTSYPQSWILCSYSPLPIETQSDDRDIWTSLDWARAILFRHSPTRFISIHELKRISDWESRIRVNPPKLADWNLKPLIKISSIPTEIYLFIGDVFIRHQVWRTYMPPSLNFATMTKEMDHLCSGYILVPISAIESSHLGSSPSRLHSTTLTSTDAPC